MADYPAERLLERLNGVRGRHSSEEGKNVGLVVGNCLAPCEKLHLIK